MTSNTCHTLRSVLGWWFLSSMKSVRSWRFFSWHVMSLCHAVTLAFNPLIVNVFSILAAMWSNIAPNLSEIKQSAAELLLFQYVQFGRCPSSCIWPEVDFYNFASSDNRYCTIMASCVQNLNKTGHCSGSNYPAFDVLFVYLSCVWLPSSVEITEKHKTQNALETCSCVARCNSG